MLLKYIIDFHLLILEVDWSQIWHNTRYFLLGLATGIVLLMLSLLFIFSRRERKKTKIRLSNQFTLDNKVLEDMILSKQNQLEKTVRITDNGYFKVALDLSLELTEEIARYYFPDSKFPIYELSVQEIINLSNYITNRFDELMNGRGFKLFKNYRVASIIELLNTRKRISNSKLMQVTRKLKLQQVYNVSRAVINYANPIYWFRKLAIKPTTTLVTKELCKTIISIFGEETNKIYSKAIFKEEDNQEEIMLKLEEFADTEGEVE